MEKRENNSTDRSLVGVTVGYFTLQWLVQTIAAWGLSMWLTKMWRKHKEKKDAK